MTNDLPALKELLHSLADDVRLRLLRCLQSDSFAVSELCEILDMKQPTLSHHLRLLSESGLISSRKEGPSAFYRRTLGSVEDSYRGIVKSVLDRLDSEEINTEDASRISLIKKNRSVKAREFFNKRSDDVAITHELIAHPEQYLPTTSEILRKSLAINGGAKKVLEIGAGRGEFLGCLLELFPEIYVLDLSEEMLELARSSLSSGEKRRVKFLLGDTSILHASGLKVSHVVCNMVLHHVPSPADIFTDCGGVLEEGGSFIVTDLCRHEQSWALERCGDMWLGFDPLELTGFAERAGFKEADNAYFGLRNGFQVQVRLFEKVT